MIKALAGTDDLASRTTFTGHVTCSAIVLAAETQPAILAERIAELGQPLGM